MHACYDACMAQVTLRVPDELARRLREAAAAEGRSLNAWATAVLAAMVDPDFAGEGVTRIRERLRRAGLLAEGGGPVDRPDTQRLARARARAGRGRSLSDIVSEGRG